MENATFAIILEELASDLRRVDHAAFLNRLKPIVTLHGWTPSIRQVAALRGLAIGHPLIGDRMINTSEVFFLDSERGLARTLTRWYRLADLASSHAATSTEY